VRTAATTKEVIMRRQVSFKGNTKVARAIARAYELDFQKKEIEAELEAVRSVIIDALQGEVDARSLDDNDRKVAVVAGRYQFDFDAELKAGLKDVEAAVEVAKARLEDVTIMKPVPDRTLIRNNPAIADNLGQYHKIQRIKVRP
jgi:hypothetical protein